MDAVEQPEKSTPVPADAPSPSAAYARLSTRVNAMLMDAVIAGGVLILLVIGGGLTEDVPGSGRVFLVLWFAWALLYEPLQVWLYGGTIGHRRSNLRVVSDKTGGAPTFPVSFARFLVKSVLGLPSFISMAFTRRHQAIHDLVTGTTVQMRDLSIVDRDDYLVERLRDSVTIEIPAPASRRLFVTLLYIVAAYLLSGVLSIGLVSNRCLSGGECSTTDSTNSSLITYMFLAGVLAIAIQGLRGRLWGTRPRVEVAPVTSAPTETEPPAE